MDKQEQVAHGLSGPPNMAKLGNNRTQHSVSVTRRNEGMSGETSGVLVLFLPPPSALSLRYKET